MFHSRSAFVRICNRGSRRSSRQLHQQVQTKSNNVTRSRINMNRRNDLIVAVCLERWTSFHTLPIFWCGFNCGFLSSYALLYLRCLPLIKIYFLARLRLCQCARILSTWVNTTKHWVRRIVRVCQPCVSVYFSIAMCSFPRCLTLTYLFLLWSLLLSHIQDSCLVIFKMTMRTRKCI